MYTTLQKYLRPKVSRRFVYGFIALLPILACISWFFMGFEWNPTSEHPGGRFLEISYWATSFGAVFLSFMMMELLLRSRETRLLATYPVPPMSIFVFQMRRVFWGIGLSTLAYAAFWAPQLITTPLIATLCILIWPLGLAICAALGAAIILYAGESATTEKNNLSAGAMAFSMAPAIALAVSLVTTLLLKLLAEALLKPGFVDAAITATAITAAVFVGAMIYAARLYQRRYYAILASFMDNDLVVLNASYDFLDGKEAQVLRTHAKLPHTLCHALILQFKRRYPMTSILVGTLAIIIGLALWHNPDYIPYLYVTSGNWIYWPCFTILPTLIFAKPWVAFRSPDFETELNVLLPISQDTWRNARNTASLKLTLPYHILLSFCAALPIATHQNMGTAMLTFALSAITCLLMTWGCCHITHHKPQHATLISSGIAMLMMLIGVLL